MSQGGIASNNATVTGNITQINGDSGRAVPSAGIVTISGGSTGLTTSGSGSTLTFTGVLGVPNGGTGDSSFSNTNALLTSGTTATGAFQQIASVPTGQVLASQGVSTLPAFTATPSLTSVTFGAGNPLSIYTATTSWTPTIDGAVSGTTTYSSQIGKYMQIGNLIWVYGLISITGATGTGNAIIGGFPLTFANLGNDQIAPCGLSGTGWSFGTGITQLFVGQDGSTSSNFLIFGYGSGKSLAFVQMANAAASFIFQGCFSA